MFKRTITVIALVALMSYDAIGQVTRLEVAAQVGPSFGWLRGNRLVDGSDALLGPTAGLGLQYNFSPVLGIRLGVGYQLKGTSSEVTFTDVNGSPLGAGTLDQELNYLSIPLMLRCGFGEKFRMTFGVGGYAGVLMSAKLTSQAFDFDQTVTDDLEDLDMGISASMEGSLRLGAQFAVNAEIRYDKGLTNISALPVVDDGSIRTNAVSLLVGCSYRFGGAL